MTQTVRTDSLRDHECAAEHCSRMIPKVKLMCPAHWAKVPKALQRNLADAFAAWRRGADGGGTTSDMIAANRKLVADLRRAQRACVDAVGYVRVDCPDANR